MWESKGASKLKMAEVKSVRTLGGCVILFRS